MPWDDADPWRRASLRPHMDVLLGANQYGKVEVRLAVVDRRRPQHEFCDLTVSIALSGELAAVHTHGDNANIVATDTQKNTVFALAKAEPVGEIEEFGLRLARHFVGSFTAITRARVHIESARWRRLEVGGEPHPHAFERASEELRTATVVCDQEGEWVLSGLQDLVVLKTSGSEFHGFLRDRYTTLPETRDRILSTAVRARWRHAGTSADWGPSHAGIRAAMLERFAELHSLSLQQTLYEMARAALAADEQVVELRLSLPNRHHFVVDLERFGLENDNEIFRVEDRPYGLIEGQVLRRDAPPAGPAWDPYPLV